jgi:hypothetical protein
MSIDCSRWDFLLDDWREGRLDELTARTCDDHVETCDRCRDILTVLEGMTEINDSPDLCADVLAATSGGTCERALTLLGERPDGGLSSRHCDLLDSHLKHCSDCAELARILHWTMPVLHDMAEFEADQAFTYDVLRATSASRARRRAGAWQRGAERASAWWEGLSRRPHFAMEMAYVATVLAVLIFGTPLSPARNAPRKALEVVQASPVWVMEHFASVVGSAGGVLDSTRDDIGERRDRTAPDRSDLQRHGKELGSALIDRKFDNAEQELNVIRTDLEKLWDTWRASGLADTPRDSTQETNGTGNDS